MRPLFVRPSSICRMLSIAIASRPSPQPAVLCPAPAQGSYRYIYISTGHFVGLGRMGGGCIVQKIVDEK